VLHTLRPTTTNYTDCKLKFYHQDKKSCHSLRTFPDENEAPNCAKNRKTSREVASPTGPELLLLLKPAVSQARLFPTCCSLSFPSDNLCLCLAIAFSKSTLTELEKSKKNGHNCCSIFSWVANTLEYQAGDRQLHTWTSCLAQFHNLPPCSCSLASSDTSSAECSWRGWISSEPALGLTGMELVSCVAVCMLLSFEFVTIKVLTTHQCFGYC